MPCRAAAHLDVVAPSVPLIMISPCSRKGHITHTIYEYSSFLKSVERRFGLPSLTERDLKANDMLDSFDFSQPPLPPLFILAGTSLPDRSSNAVVDRKVVGADRSTREQDQQGQKTVARVRIVQPALAPRRLALRSSLLSEILPATRDSGT